MGKKYWLHRISHWACVSYPLLEKGYLTIGFNDVLGIEPNVASKLQQDKMNYSEFELIIEKSFNDLKKNRRTLWDFLKNFQEGDIVIVPSSKTFAVFEICNAALPIDDLPETDIKDWNGRTLMVAQGKGLCYMDEVKDNGKKESVVDLGFYVKVKPITNCEGGMFVARKAFLTNNLLEALKYRGTTRDITSLKTDIDEAIERVNKNESIDFYKIVSQKTLPVIQDFLLNIPGDNEFEKLVKWYLKKIGADSVIIPPKNSPDKAEGADADVIAYFDAIGVSILVQVKHHRDITYGEAVQQISKYIEQQPDDEISQIGWVISSANDFSDQARQDAVQQNVRLFNGKDFAQMLLDAGFLNINEALK